jgi:hypothetical protein
MLAAVAVVEFLEVRQAPAVADVERMAALTTTQQLQPTQAQAVVAEVSLSPLLVTAVQELLLFVI